MRRGVRACTLHLHIQHQDVGTVFDPKRLIAQIGLKIRIAHVALGKIYHYVALSSSKQKHHNRRTPKIIF